MSKKKFKEKTKEEINKLRKKMTPEELEAHYNYTRVSGHVHRDKTKYDRKRDKKKIEKEWK